MNEAREKAEFEYFDGQEENESNYRRFNDWRNGYDSRDAEVEGLRKELRAANKGAKTNALVNQGLVKRIAELQAALSSGTQETK